MTYFGFLARFVVLPTIIIRWLIWRDNQKKKNLPEALTNWDAEKALFAHSAVALTYTTIWDNYLVATKVWEYDPELVTGIRFGWVPVEEYTFFVLQPLLTGSFLQYLMRRMPPSDAPYPPDKNLKPRLLATGALGIIWLMSLRKMFEGNPNNTYLSLITAWALPPVMFQTAFGGDILWRNRKLILTNILISTAYLGVADSISIGKGTWGINPEKTIGVDVIPHLPFEEFFFFLITNVLLTLGVTLVMSKESENRLPERLRDTYYKFKARWLKRNS